MYQFLRQKNGATILTIAQTGRNWRWKSRSGLLQGLSPAVGHNKLIKKTYTVNLRETMELVFVLVNREVTRAYHFSLSHSSAEYHLLPNESFPKETHTTRFFVDLIHPVPTTFFLNDTLNQACLFSVTVLKIPLNLRG